MAEILHLPKVQLAFSQQTPALELSNSTQLLLEGQYLSFWSVQLHSVRLLALSTHLFTLGNPHQNWGINKNKGTSIILVTGKSLIEGWLWKKNRKIRDSVKKNVKLLIVLNGVITVHWHACISEFADVLSAIFGKGISKYLAFESPPHCCVNVQSGTIRDLMITFRYTSAFYLYCTEASVRGSAKKLFFSTVFFTTYFNS